jgi:fatty acid desaturase
MGAEIGVVFWTLFAYWLFFNSVYVIGVLCPWCLVVTFSMTILSAAITRYNLLHGTFDIPKRMNKKLTQFLAKDYDKVIVAGWLVLLVGLVILRFGEALVA